MNWIFCIRTGTGFLIVAAGLLSLSTDARSDITRLGPGLTSLEFVSIDDPGNSSDTRYSSPGYGSVEYSFQMGKFEVTAAQYTEFLNAVAISDAYGLYNNNMWTNPFGCKIERIGDSGNYKYQVAVDWANRPVNYVSFWDAARFANWLHNGRPTGEQDATTTEDGAYTLNGYEGSDVALIMRNPGANFWIPSEDEWYKAAYFDPLSNQYWDYPTGTNSSPSNDLISPDPGNNANFEADDFSINEPYWRTVVGEFENSYSPYGTFDQGGNVLEWNESIITSTSGVSYREYRGGQFHYIRVGLKASARFSTLTDNELGSIGFRVARRIPEPSTFALALPGIVLTCLVRSMWQGPGDD